MFSELGVEPPFRYISKEFLNVNIQVPSESINFGLKTLWRDTVYSIWEWD